MYVFVCLSIGLKNGAALSDLPSASRYIHVEFGSYATVAKNLGLLSLVGSTDDSLRSVPSSVRMISDRFTSSVRQIRTAPLLRLELLAVRTPPLRQFTLKS